MLIPWYLKVAGVVAVVAGVALTVSVHDAHQRADGQQAIRDSLNTVMAARLSKQADSARKASVALVDSARATADSVHRSSVTFDAGVHRLAAIPALPPIRVTPGDTVVLDDTAYLVPHPIAHWVGLAHDRILVQDSVLKLAAQIINVGVPRLQARYESALASKDTAIAALDSVATFERTLRLAAEKRRSTGPSKWQTTLKWGEIAGAAYIGYRVAKR